MHAKHVQGLWSRKHVGQSRLGPELAMAGGLPRRKEQPSQLRRFAQQCTVHLSLLELPSGCWLSTPRSTATLLTSDSQGRTSEPLTSHQVLWPHGDTGSLLVKEEKQGWCTSVMAATLTPPRPQFPSLGFISFFSEEEELEDFLLRYSVVRSSQHTSTNFALLPYALNHMPPL